MLLDRYVGWVVARAFLLVALGLSALFCLLNFVEQLGLIGQGRYRLPDALSYTLLTAPSRLLQIAPIAMLLAVLLGLGQLERGLELTGFRSFGVSEARIIGAVVKLCLPVTLMLFLTAQFVIPPAQQAAQREQARSLGAALPGLLSGGFWVTNGHVFLNVQGFAGGHTLRDISIFSFEGGTLQLYLQASEAEVTPNGDWTLRHVLRKRIRNDQTETDRPDQLAWTPFLSARQLRLLAMPPQTLAPTALYARLRQAPRQPAAAYAQAFWGMVAIPLTLVGMALIAAPFVFSAPRAGGSGRQLLIGALIGIVFLLGQQITGYAGLLLDANPALAALAPSLLLLALGGGWMLRRGNRAA